MMSSIIAYPITPDMGTREALNAMLSHVAYESDGMGYRAPTVLASNYRALLRDYAPLVVEHSTEHWARVLIIAPHVDRSDILADLAETLIKLCNDYPLYDEQDYSELEESRLIEFIDDERADETDPPAADIARALWECDLQAIHESDGSVYISETDFHAAIAYARATATAEAN
ncbi:hypothetical protein [Frigoribacterium sp. UYMn621]|uniref:hypothetical protein n=1 Tax=Frigoribacterium sp. UYMn621 TaxID=3156343 RepID=UPI00339A18A0